MENKSMYEIIFGTYEEFILGFKYNTKEEETTQSFATHSHSGSIRSVAQCEGLLASGGADDRIIVYDLKLRKEHVMLTHHNGTVNCLAFTPQRTHLISGGQDGMLAIARIGNWQLEKIWEKAHKGAAILDIAVHSSGKLAFTLGADCTLRTWNLIKGRQAYIINLYSKCMNARSLHSIKFAPDGTRFTLVGGNTTDIWSLETGGIVKSIKHKMKVCGSAWENDTTLLVGYEEGEIGVVNTETGVIDTHKAHDSRVKCISIFGKYIVSGCSKGELKIWTKNFQELSTMNAGCRFTCICILPPLKADKVETTEENEVVGESCEKENAEGIVVESDEDEVVEVPAIKKRKGKVNKKSKKLRT